MAVVSDLSIAVYGFKPRKKIIEKAGISYEYRLIKDKLTLGLSTLPVFQNASLASSDSLSNFEKVDDSDMNFMDKDDSKYKKYVSKLDPSDFKDQDHYRVLGLSKLRYKASANQLKLACKFIDYILLQ